MKTLAALLITTVSLLAAETNQPPERPGLEIKADFAEFRLKERVFYYSNNVQVTDPPAKPGDPPTILRCRELTARQNAQGKFESIVALSAVQIDQGEKRARGHQAVYTSSNEWMVLTGPFDPADTNQPLPILILDQNTIVAEEIIYDRRENRLFFNKQQRTDISAATVNKANRGDTNSTSTNKSLTPKSPFPFN